MYESFTKYLANNVCQLVVGIQAASALIIKPNDMPDTRPTRRLCWRLKGHFALIYSCTLVQLYGTRAERSTSPRVLVLGK